MPRVSFTPTLRRHLDVPARTVTAATVGAALDAICTDHPTLRGYLLDDQGRLRHHVAVFVDDIQLRGGSALTHPLEETSEVVIMQALSGG